MYRIITVMSILLMLCNISVKAQDIPKTNNILVGFSPLVHTRFSLGDSELKYKTWSADIFKEANYRYLTYHWGVTYTRGKLEDDFDLNGADNIFDMEDLDKFQKISLSALGGFTLFPTRRFQIPLLFGFDIGHEKIGSFSGVTVGYQMKGLVRYFFTKRIGVFVGGTLDIDINGVDVKPKDNDTETSNNKNKKDNTFSASPINKMLNVGIVISLNK